MDLSWSSREEGAATTHLARFDEHRARLEVLLDSADAWLLDTTERPDQLARLRWEMTRALTEFQMFKHRAIFDPLLRWGTPMQAHLAKALKTACTEAGEGWRAYVLRWSTLGSAGNWTAYRDETRAIVRGLRDSLAEQRRQIVTLLELAPACPPPAGAGGF